MKMKNKIFLFIAGVLFFVSCSEDFITKDLDKVVAMIPVLFSPQKTGLTKRLSELIQRFAVNMDKHGEGSTLCTWFSVTTFMKPLKHQDLHHGASINNFNINANDVSGVWNSWYAAIQRQILL